MITLLKIAGVSAILSAGVVTAYEPATAALAPASGKIFAERLGEAAPRPILLAQATSAALPVVDRSAKGDAAPRHTAADACAGQAWPYVTPGCVAASNGAEIRKVSRTIAIDGAAPAALASR